MVVHARDPAKVWNDTLTVPWIWPIRGMQRKESNASWFIAPATLDNVNASHGFRQLRETCLDQCYFDFYREVRKDFYKVGHSRLTVELSGARAGV